MMQHLLSTVLLAAAAFASPAPAGYGFCATVNSKISAGNEREAATAYCSSYLSIPVYTTKVCRTKTYTTTKTTGGETSTVTAPEITSTITSTSTLAVSTNSFSTTTTITDASTVTPTVSIYNCQVPFARPDGRKRSVQDGKPQKPQCFSDYTGKKAKSSACSCVSVKPSTTTIVDSTITKTVTKQSPGSTSTITPTKLVTSIITTSITASVTTTLTESISTTTTSSSTVTVNAVRPKYPFAIGAYKPGSAFEGFYLQKGTGITSAPVFVNQYPRGVNPYSVNDDGNLVDYRDYYNQHRGGGDPSSPYDDPERITFGHSDQSTTTDLAIGNLPCTIEVKDDYMCYLHCSLGDKKTNYICADGSWYLGSASEAPKPGCETFTPLVADVPYQR